MNIATDMNLKGGSPNERPEIVQLLSGKGKKVLDVGCAWGDMGQAIKKNFGHEITGIEIDENKAKIASSKLDKVLQGDVESMDPGFEERYFDYIIFADVLEHLRSPRESLRKFMKYMRDDGYVIISIPNIRYIKVLYDLCVLGEWEYRPFGIMDEGHLRFFTKKSIIGLLKEAGLSSVYMGRIFSFKGSRALNTITLGALKDLLAIQYVLVAQKDN